MFLRWKRRSCAPRWEKDETLLSAVLVESCRVGKGVRQRIVRYLGSIRESGIPLVQPRIRFLKEAAARLATSGLTEIEQNRIAGALLACIPCPTPEEIAAERKEVADLIAKVQSIRSAHK